MLDRTDWLKDGTLGEWWTPEAPNAKRVGVLRRVADVWRLDLYGVLGCYQYSQQDRRYEAIYGWIPSVGFIGLQECTAFKTVCFGPSQYESELEHIQFSRLLRKSIGDNAFPQLYTSVEVKAPELFYWCGSNGLRTLRPERSDEGKAPIYTYQYSEPHRIKLLWGDWKLLFWMQAGSFPFPVGRSLEISQDQAISLEFVNGLDLLTFEMKTRSLSALLSLLAGSNIDLQMFSVTPKRESLEADKAYPMDFLKNGEAIQMSKQAADGSADHYFKFGSVERNFETLLLGWDASVDRYGYRVIDYFAKLPNNDGIRRFMDAANLVHAIVEVDARILMKKQKIKVPFREAILQASRPFSRLDPAALESLADAIEATRHSLAHPQSNLKSKAANGLQLAHAEAFLDSVLRCLIWTGIGLSNAEIRTRCSTHQELNDKLSMNFWRAIE